MQKITVQVPASTSNFGPGYDCLGAALQLYNHVTIRREDECRSPRMIGEAARLFFKESREWPFSFSCDIQGDVPASRGLGGSACVRLGVLLGLNHLTGTPMDRSSIFRLAARLEGHPDNAAPAAFGGFTIVRGQAVQRFKVSPKLYFVLLIPNFEIKTSQARKVLPARIDRLAAVESCANACAITAAFASGNYENLRGAFVDRFHQPFRESLIPILPRVIAAAEKAGALGVFLSGSGSTIAAVTLDSPKKVATAMLRAAKWTAARIVVTKVDNNGAHMLSIANRKSKIAN